jgi:hypothetical protein
VNEKLVKLPQPMDFDDMMRRVVRVKPEHRQPRPKTAKARRNGKAKR